MKLENLHKAIAMSGVMSLAITGCVHHAGTDKESQVMASAQGIPAPGLLARLSGKGGTGVVQEASQWPEKPDESRNRAKFNQLFPHLSQRLDRRARVEVGQPVAIAAENSATEPVKASAQSADNAAAAAGLTPVQEAANIAVAQVPAASAQAAPAAQTIQAMPQVSTATPQTAGVSPETAANMPQASQQTASPVVQSAPAQSAPVASATAVTQAPAVTAQSAPAVSAQSAPVAPIAPAAQALPVAASPQVVAAPVAVPQAVAAPTQTASPQPAVTTQPVAAPAVSTSTLPPIDTPAAPPEIKPAIVPESPAPATPAPAPPVAPAAPAIAPVVAPQPAQTPAPVAPPTAPVVAPAAPAPVAPGTYVKPSAPAAPAAPAPVVPPAAPVVPAPSLPPAAPVPARPSAEPPARPEPKKPSEELSGASVTHQANPEKKLAETIPVLPGIPVTQPANSNPVVVAAEPVQIPGIPDSPPAMAAPAIAAEEIVQKPTQPVMAQAAPAEPIPAIPAIPANDIKPTATSALAQVNPNVAITSPTLPERQEVEQIAALPTQPKPEINAEIPLNQPGLTPSVAEPPPIPSTVPEQPSLPVETRKTAIVPEKPMAQSLQVTESKATTILEVPLPAPAPEANIPAIPAIPKADEPPAPLSSKASTEDPGITRSSGSLPQPTNTAETSVTHVSEKAKEAISTDPAPSAAHPASETPAMKVPTDEEPVKVLQPLPDDEADDENKMADANESARVFRKTENGFVIRLELKNPLRRWTSRQSDEPVFRPTQSGLATLRSSTREIYEKGKNSLASRLLGYRNGESAAPSTNEQPMQMMAASPAGAEKQESASSATAESEEKPSVAANPVEAKADKMITATPSSPAIIQPVKAVAPPAQPATTKTVAISASANRNSIALNTAPGLPPVEFPASYAQAGRRSANPWANQANPAVAPRIKPDLEIASYEMLRSVQREPKPAVAPKSDRSIIATSMTVAVNKLPLASKVEASKPIAIEATKPAASEKASTGPGLLKRASDGLRGMVFGKEEVVPPKRQTWTTQNWSSPDRPSIKSFDTIQSKNPGFNRLSPGL